MHVAHPALALTLLAGLVHGDGGEHGEHGGHHEVHQAAPEPSQQLVDNSAYYSQQQYPDPFAQNFLTQEQDRTDVGLLSGITVGMLITVFLAALLGSLVAPALTAAVTRTAGLAAGVPDIVKDIELPTLKLKDQEEEEGEEEGTRRALEAGWSL